MPRPIRPDLDQRRPAHASRRLARPPRRPIHLTTLPLAAAETPGWEIRDGDCIDRLREMPPASVDAVITDPPYGIHFNGHDWDGPNIHKLAAQRTGRKLSEPEAFEIWAHAWATETLRVLKPGGHLLAFGSPRTFHRLGCGLEDAGFQLRDTLSWLYGTGMPKSRRLLGGQSTLPKPAWEPILMARRPPAGTAGQNLAIHGTGGLNVEACRVNGRYPANVLLSHSHSCTTAKCTPACPTVAIDRTRTSATAVEAARRASRIFYCPKPTRRERDAGCQDLPVRSFDVLPNASKRAVRSARNVHPTVKPLEVMRWLVRLATPVGGLVLDPFCGSGTTGAAALLERRPFLGIELDVDYQRIAHARIRYWARKASDTMQAHDDASGPLDRHGSKRT